MIDQNKLNEIYKELEPIFMKISECTLSGEEYVFNFHNGKVIFKV